MPGLLAPAYADNITLLGLLSEVTKAAGILKDLLGKVDLTLNTEESVFLVPKWLKSQSQNLRCTDPRGVSESENGTITIQTSDGSEASIPVATRGIKLLGCPIGTQEYTTEILTTLCKKVKNDLQRLSTDFSYLHQRTKLAIFCCNVRPAYMSRLLPHTITGPHLEDLDVSFDDFMASTLQFPPDYKNGHDKDLYTLALQQIRLGIKQGGFGLTSRSLVAPALVYVSLETFSAWFAQYRKFWIGQDVSLRLSWLTPLVAQSSIPQSLIDYSDSAKSQLESYDIQFRAIDQSDAKPKHLLQDINEQLKTYSVNLFRSSPALQQGGLHRLKSLGVQSVPAQSPQSDLNPGEDLDLDDENRDRQTFLRHKPMALFALMCSCEVANYPTLPSFPVLPFSWPGSPGQVVF